MLSFNLSVAPFTRGYRRGFVEDFPPLFDDSDKKDYERKWNALISYFFKVPFPEQLDYEDWMEKVKQLEWLAKRGILGVEFKEGLL